jgi:hypothetical protein
MLMLLGSETNSSRKRPLLSEIIAAQVYSGEPNAPNSITDQTTKPFSVDIAGLSEFQLFHHTHINYHKLGSFS